ncbi:hypothetical protein CW731_10385 [Polaribacter sp. ALD11]|nr:hypothetical protein [Polaribacter sp. ALD11]AUC85669.1 hypothetical protein CW731_10385 [Polaribacter sp. ALD11]
MKFQKNLQSRFLLRVDFDEIYYSNKNETIQQINVYGEDFIISYPLFNWRITQEKRMIGKYMCFKAKVIKEVQNLKVFIKLL